MCEVKFYGSDFSVSKESNSTKGVLRGLHFQKEHTQGKPDYDFEGHRELVGMQPGDVPLTYADCKALEEDYGFVPKIGIREGLRNFSEWYKEYMYTDLPS